MKNYRLKNALKVLKVEMLPLWQGGNERYRQAWQHICALSRKEFEQIYQRLKIRIEEKVSLCHILFVWGNYSSLYGCTLSCRHWSGSLLFLQDS
jgi:hypothetical protein